MNKITARIDAITGIPEEYRSASPPAPKSVKIELTGRCNFNCWFCAKSQGLRKLEHMPWENYRRIARELRDIGVEELGMFFLGESFLYPHLPDAIHYAKELGFPYVFLTTNGSLATPQKLEPCFKAGLDSLKFSLNYADEKQFGEIARVSPRMFHRMIDNIKEARRLRDAGGYSCGLYASYILFTGDQGEKMRHLVAELRPYLDEIYELPLYNQAALVDNPDWEFTAGNMGRRGNLRDPLPCWVLFTEGHITYDGELAACCFDHHGGFAMGNLNEMSFMEAWRSEKFQKLRKAHLKKEVRETVCGQCVAWA